ncbi:MAG: hypothetical protein HQK84_09650, partial [Nitrospinae bacterium]|nr:hypothetical protein [Nitrospinota bacterium]
LKKLQSLHHCHIKDIGNGLAFIFNFQRFTVVSLTLTKFAGYINIRQKMHYEGIINNLKRRYVETSSEYIRSQLEKLMSFKHCSGCGGGRLRKESLSVKVGGANVQEFTTKTIKDAKDFIDKLNLDPYKLSVGERVLKEIALRLDFLVNVGLDYLNLSRTASTLSGGESQRIRLATQIGSGLMGVLYILDEPSIGLHQRDNERLLQTLNRLRDLGNTVIVVEHDEDTIRQADYIFDLGPGAGKHGGYVVAEGTIDDILKSKESVTGQFLSGADSIPVPEKENDTKL